MKRRKQEHKGQFDDVLVVLGCSPQKNGHPSAVMLSRIEKAIKQYRLHYFDKVVLTGGAVKYPVPEAAIMAVFLHDVVPKEKLLLEDKARSTIENALFVWELLKGHHVRRMTIITSDFHLAKARYVFTKIFEHKKVRLDFISAKSKLGLFRRMKAFIKNRIEILRMRLWGIK